MNYKLNDISTVPSDNIDKEEIKHKTIEIKKELDELQNLFYAKSSHSMLIILQGMDASGKDGAIRKVFSGLNPQGIHVYSFKQPTKEELSHDFLWRIHKQTPEKGKINIFNRSHYEDVIVTRVKNIIDDETANNRFEDINNFEKLLKQNLTIILKFYLHISEEEQFKNLEDRLKDPRKKWKYNPDDMSVLKERNIYMRYYEEAFVNCSKYAEWNIIPCDKNWYKEYLIADKLYKTLKELNLEYPN